MGLSDEPKDSRFLYADDFLKDGVWKAPVLTVREVIAPGTMRAADGNPVMSTAIGFEKTPKVLVLNTTNHRLCKLHFGTENPAAWVGKKIQLNAALINCFGEKDVPCIRVKLSADRPVPLAVRKHLGRDLTGVTVQMPAAAKAEGGAA